MMKFIVLILLLFSSTAFSASELQRVTSTQLGNGYMFRFVENSQIICWGMPDNFDTSYVNPTWMLVTQTATLYHWPAMEGDTIAACLSDSLRLPRTVQMSDGELLYMQIIGPRKTLVNGPVIPEGLPCGDIASRYFKTDFYWRSVTYAGVTGVALCY